MAKSAGVSKGHMKGHGKASVRGPRKTGKGGRKPKNYNARGIHSKMYSKRGK